MPARLALVAAAVLAGLTVPASAASAWSPTPPKITYMNHTGGDYEVTTMNTDGSGVKQLTANTVSDMDPVFSPDGTEIAWAHQVSPNAAELYVMPANGPTPTNPAQQITVDPSGSIRTPSWSLDGSTIYFARAHYDASGTPTTDDIDAVHRVGGMWGEETTVMHDETAFQYEPVISPDGTKLAFDRDPDGPGGSIQSQIWVANIDGTNPHRVSSPSGTAQEYESTWSPDGKQIAFSNGYINTVSLATGTQTKVSSGYGYWPEWTTSKTSPNELLYDAYSSRTGYDVVKLNLAARKPSTTTLTTSRDNDINSDW